MKSKKRIRLEDIARELNVSAVSVSNALRNKKGVGEELRQRVKAKAEELGYQAAKSAENAAYAVQSPGKTYCIGIMIAEKYMKEFPSFYMDIYKEIVRIFSEHDGLTALEIVGDGQESAKPAGRYFAGIKINAVLFIGEMESTVIREIRRKKKVPAVGIESAPADRTMDSVMLDDFHETRRLTQQLIDAGQREIPFYGDPYSSERMLDRYMGYCSALEANGIRECRNRILPDGGDTGDGMAAVLPGYRRPGSERILAQNGVDLLMKHLQGEETKGRMQTTECRFVETGM